MPDVLLGKNIRKLPMCSEHDLITLWYRIVCCYTARSLIRESDGFTALHGIAKETQARFNSKYLPGLWERDLAKGLGWNVCTTTNCPRVPISRRPSPYRTPTWSWPSVEGQVEWKPMPQPSGINILRSHCEISHLDTIGGVHSGYLHLAGYFISAYYHYGYQFYDESSYSISSEVSCCDGSGVNHARHSYRYRGAG